ncbi:hypothetical protein CMEL01_09377 [Colletotrichum melonis]|uniref:Uncharacterized protein n=1 Tax=Colletotrichum melonis TaxID=1209925 RepID=A0AAI9XFY0_9PEZI|nr:hypothetical protein CMEL01_09377 [Colletotrichum melonis]
MHHPPLDPNHLGIPIIPIKHPLRNPILPALPPKHINISVLLLLTILIDNRQPNKLRIPLQPNLKPANLPAQANNFGTAPRAEIQHLLNRQLSPLLLLPLQPHRNMPRHQRSLSRRLEYTRTIPTAHIRPQPDIDPLIPQPPHPRRTARDGAVTTRTMRHLRAPLRNSIRLLLRQMNRVREHHLLPQQPMAVIHIRITLRLREQLLHKLNLPLILRNMRLREHIQLPLQPRQSPHRLPRTSRRKPRRQYRRDELKARVDPPDMLHALPRLTQRVGRGLVLVVVRAQPFAVHAYPPDERPLAKGEADVGEEVRCGDVDCGVVCRGGGAVGERAFHAGRVDAFCLFLVGEGGFEGEGVGV